jgi:hypothetical protein
MNIIRKGQTRWLPKNDIVGQKSFVERILGIAARGTANCEQHVRKPSVRPRFATLPDSVARDYLDLKH